MAETNRAPFDLPEAESELVAGYNIEYSSISFAVFFLAEYNHIIIASFLFSLVFLGGWDFLFLNFFSNYSSFHLLFKSIIIINLFIYVRGVVPRYRFTDLITMCWQVFVPVTIFALLILILIIALNTIIMYDGFFSIKQVIFSGFLFYFFVEILISIDLFLKKYYFNDLQDENEFKLDFQSYAEYDSFCKEYENTFAGECAASIKLKSRSRYKDLLNFFTSYQQKFIYYYTGFIILLFIPILIIFALKLDHKIYKIIVFYHFILAY